jgi:hypothetical protein
MVHERVDEYKSTSQLVSEIDEKITAVKLLEIQSWAFASADHPKVLAHLNGLCRLRLDVLEGRKTWEDILRAKPRDDHQEVVEAITTDDFV